MQFIGKCETSHHDVIYIFVSYIYFLWENKSFCLISQYQCTPQTIIYSKTHHICRIKQKLQHTMAAAAKKPTKMVTSTMENTAVSGEKTNAIPSPKRTPTPAFPNRGSRDVPARTYRRAHASTRRAAFPTVP